LEYHRNCL